MQDSSIPALPPAAAASDEHTHTCPHSRHRRGFAAKLVVGILGAGLVGFAIGAAMPVAEAAMGAMARHSDSPGGPPSLEEARDHAEFFVAFALHRLDATPDQEDRVHKVVDGAIDNLFPVIGKHRANREELRNILSSPTIDRSAIEKLRVEELALADELSRTLAGAIGDTAEILSPEQRTTLIERLDRFRHRH